MEGERNAEFKDSGYAGPITTKKAAKSEGRTTEKEQPMFPNYTTELGEM